MRIGLLKEIKPDEMRVGLTPHGVAALVADGHRVLVERGAGEGSGFPDDEYGRAGAALRTRDEVGRESEIIVKVKEPLKEEYDLFRPGLIVYTYFHLAPVRELTLALVESGVTCVAYETVQLEDGSLPLLTPMSEVAGRMATQIGAQFLERPNGGRGILLGGVPGVPPGRVVVVGGGTVGQNAATIARGMGADTWIFDVSARRLRQLDELFQGRVRTVMSTPAALGEAVADADLLVGAVLIPGARAPRIVTEAMVASMRPGSVIVDVAIDQGGSIETIDRITTHSDPVYVKYDVVHYAVANMPGAVPRTSTLALTNVTLPYLRHIAGQGLREAMVQDTALRRGLNVMDGKVTYQAVATAHDLPYTPAEEVLGIGNSRTAV